MVEIIFQKQEDAMKLYNHLESRFSSTKAGNPILLNEDRHIVKIPAGGGREYALETIKIAFYDFIIDTKREDWFREILANQYFYSDPEEQQQVLDIIYSLLEGNREELTVFIKDINEDVYLKQAVDSIFQENLSFSFDSFVKFRLRTFIDKLRRYVEISIDEYKLEQEYQIFVQTLREFLAQKQAKYDHLHLLLSEDITFFNEQFYEIKRGELAKIIDRKLLFNHPVYVDSATIAPLLSIAPASLYLYTADPDQPLVHTIRNIFEERINVFPVAVFYEKQRTASGTPKHKN